MKFRTLSYIWEQTTLFYFVDPIWARLSAASFPAMPRCPGTWVYEKKVQKYINKLTAKFGKLAFQELNLCQRKEKYQK